LKSEGSRDFQQCFYLLTREEWDQFHIRHPELHLSFIVPVGDSTEESERAAYQTQEEKR